MELFAPIGSLSRVGVEYQKKLKKLGIETIKDLLYHFPHRYEDFSDIIPISNIKPDEPCSICGRISEVKNTRTWKKRMFLTEITIEDNSGKIKALWFNQLYLTTVFKKNSFFCLAGKDILKNNITYLSNPI